MEEDLLDSNVQERGQGELAPDFYVLVFAASASVVAYFSSDFFASCGYLPFNLPFTFLVNSLIISFTDLLSLTKTTSLVIWQKTNPLHQIKYFLCHLQILYHIVHLD